MATRKKSRKVKIPSRRSPGALIFMLLFAVIGAIVTFRILAAPTVDPAKNIVGAYVNSKPIRIKYDSKGNPTYLSYPSSYILLADGTLLCDDGNSAGNVNTGKLNSAQLKNLKNQVESLNLNPVSGVVSPKGVHQHTGSFEGYLVNDGKTAREFAVYPGAAKPVKLSRLQKIAQQTCGLNAKEIKKRDSKDFNLPHGKESRVSARAITAQAYALISSALLDKAYATQPAPTKTPTSATTKTPVTTSTTSSSSTSTTTASTSSTGTSSTPAPTTVSATENTTAEDRVLHAIRPGYIGVNDYRAQKGLPQLVRQPCLDSVARKWANYQATNNTFGHNSSLSDQVKSSCPYRIQLVAENIGWGDTTADIDWNANSIVNGWLQSSLHLQNIENSGLKYIGVGVYKSGSQKSSGYYASYYVTDFATW